MESAVENASWWARSVKKCVYSDYVHTDRLDSVVKPGGRWGRLAAQIGYNTQILFSFRAAPWYAGERLGRNEVEITKENDYGLLYLSQPRLRG